MLKNIDIKGGDELLRFLDDLPRKWADKVLRGGARAAAAVVRDDARTRVRHRSGATAKAIKVSSPRRDGDVVSVKVKLRGRHAYVGVFLEFGVEPHEIAPKKGKVALKLGEDVYRRAVHHPGFGEMPFLRPALDARAADAVNAMGEYIRSRLTWGQLQAPLVSAEELNGDDE